MRTDAVASLLSRTPLFAGVDQRTVFRLAEGAAERRCSRGEIIVRQEDPGDSLFVVAAGVFKVFVMSPDGGELALVTLESPDSFGELALLDGGPRSASVKALEDGTVFVVTRKIVMEAVRESPTLMDALFKTLGAMVRRVTEQAADLVFLDLNGRVAKLLLRMSERHGQPSSDGTALDLYLTQTDLAHMVGGSRQTVNQVLRYFERRGYVQMQGRHIVIVEKGMLAHLARL